MVLRVDWIPVGERLPDKFERCWVSDEVSGIEEAVIDGRGRWAPHDDDYRSRPQAGLHHVTHWAEFETPEPPILP